MIPSESHPARPNFLTLIDYVPLESLGIYRFIQYFLNVHRPTHLIFAVILILVFRSICGGVRSCLVEDGLDATELGTGEVGHLVIR